MRHARAEEAGRGLRDADRSLTPGARRKMRSIAVAIAGLGPDFDAILTSPLLRARQTAESVARALGSRDRVIETEALSPGADSGEVLREIAKRQLRRPLLVGHMPHLGTLLGFLLTGRSDVEVQIKKAAIARVELKGDPSEAPGTLTLLLTAKALAGRGRRASASGG